MAQPGTPHRDLEVLTWPMFGVAIRELAGAIASSGFRPDLVLTIARGGLTVGGTLAYALGTKNCVMASASPEHGGHVEALSRSTHEPGGSGPDL